MYPDASAASQSRFQDRLADIVFVTTVSAAISTLEIEHTTRNLSSQ